MRVYNYCHVTDLSRDRSCRCVYAANNQKSSNSSMNNLLRIRIGLYIYIHVMTEFVGGFCASFLDGSIAR